MWEMVKGCRQGKTRTRSSGGLTPDVMMTDWNLWKTGLMAMDGSMQLRGRDKAEIIYCSMFWNMIFFSVPPPPKKENGLKIFFSPQNVKYFLKFRYKIRFKQLTTKRFKLYNYPPVLQVAGMQNWRATYLKCNTGLAMVGVLSSKGSMMMVKPLRWKVKFSAKMEVVLNQNRGTMD